MILTRREFLKKTVVASSLFFLPQMFFKSAPVSAKTTKQASCILYRSINGSPDKNMDQLIRLMGGIEKIVGPDDVIIIKPNVQWWNQGVPNLLALKTFVDLIMNQPGGFNGEVVIAENCHRGSMPWNSKSSGWAHRFELNSNLQNINNMNEFSLHLKNLYGVKYSTLHWIDVGAGNKRVNGPEEGTGYVYCDGTGGVPLISYDNGSNGGDYRAVIMSYPVFKTDKGTIIDFKNGIWEKGIYTGQPLRFINFAALNHHSIYCGATSSIKNYLGISDLSGGADPQNGGRLTKDYYNFHSFPFNKWAPGPTPGMLGGEIGVFMKTIRRASMNITTAEWIGLASRTEPPIAHTRTILACRDPVALDYHAAKYLLYPNSRFSIHNPDNKNSPLHQYLVECAKEGGGIVDDRYVKIRSYDFSTKSFQDDSNLVVVGEKKWGKNLKSIVKYLILRYWKL